ncbi:WD40-repeat-containing domain protein [Trametes meyenii]|nr:WD40-repeat-containing domain protein [Trametes meyenii]
MGILLDAAFLLAALYFIYAYPPTAANTGFVAPPAIAVVDASVEQRVSEATGPVRSARQSRSVSPVFQAQRATIFRASTPPGQPRGSPLEYRVAVKADRQANTLPTVHRVFNDSSPVARDTSTSSVASTSLVAAPKYPTGHSSPPPDLKPTNSTPRPTVPRSLGLVTPPTSSKGTSPVARAVKVEHTPPLAPTLYPRQVLFAAGEKSVAGSPMSTSGTLTPKSSGSVSSKGHIGSLSSASTTAVPQKTGAIKHRFRGFRNMAGVRGADGKLMGTYWFKTTSDSEIIAPPDLPDVRVGDVFCHASPASFQLWIWTADVATAIPYWHPVSTGHRREDGRKLALTKDLKDPTWLNGCIDVEFMSDPIARCHRSRNPISTQIGSGVRSVRYAGPGTCGVAQSAELSEASPLPADPYCLHSSSPLPLHTTMAHLDTFSSYVCARNLQGHKDSVNTVAFSRDGRFLASGGDDCTLLIFDLSTSEIVHKLGCGSPVTSLYWGGHPKDELFVGLGDGRVCVYDLALPNALMREIQQDEIEGYYIPRNQIGPVEALSGGMDAQKELLAVCAGPAVEIWTRRSSKDSASQRRDLSPRSTHFFQDNRQVAVSYLDHGVFCWELRSRTLQWRIDPRTARIGRSAMSGVKLLAVSNLYDGFDVYDVTADFQKHLRTFAVPLSINLPLPVLLTSDESEMVVGSSSGKVHVFDPTTGRELQLLDHAGDIIQALAYCDLHAGVRLLATGSSEKGGATLVRVWQRNLTSLQANGISSLEPGGAAVRRMTRESTLHLSVPRGSVISSIGPLDALPGESPTSVQDTVEETQGSSVLEKASSTGGRLQVGAIMALAVIGLAILVRSVSLANMMVPISQRFLFLVPRGFAPIPSRAEIGSKAWLNVESRVLMHLIWSWEVSRRLVLDITIIIAAFLIDTLSDYRDYAACQNYKQHLHLNLWALVAALMGIMAGCNYLYGVEMLTRVRRTGSEGAKDDSEQGGRRG